MAKPRVLMLKEHGTNCEFESRYAFEKSGAKVDIVHMEDLIAAPALLDRYQIMMFPGGFSYGDDTGSGLAWANRIRNNLAEEVSRFVEQDRLVLGVCNGFQVMLNLGILPRLDGKMVPRAAVTHNDSARYLDRWVDLDLSGKSPWVKGIRRISMPIAHGEGRFMAAPETLLVLNQRGLAAARYVRGETCEYLGLAANPNGSAEDIAGLSDETGRIFGLMPHPERAMFFSQLPHWPLLKENFRRLGRKTPEEAPGLKVFRNGVAYFR